MCDVVFKLILFILLCFLLVIGVLFLATDVNAQEKEKFTVTYKFEGLTIQQIAELDKWLKSKYPCELMEVEKEAVLIITKPIQTDTLVFPRFYFNTDTIKNFVPIPNRWFAPSNAYPINYEI